MRAAIDLAVNLAIKKHNRQETARTNATTETQKRGDSR
jgi:hypothetical protein